MAQSFTDFRALPVGDFVSSDFVNADGVASIVDNSYAQGNALLSNGGDGGWSGIGLASVQHPLDAEVSVVCADNGIGSNWRMLSLFMADPENGFATGDQYVLATRCFDSDIWFYVNDNLLGYLGNIPALADGDVYTLRSTATIGGILAEVLVNGIVILSSEVLLADLPRTTGYAGYTNRSGRPNDSAATYSFGLGTDGDSAPTSPVATGPEAPINPSITNLLTASARLTWEQG